MDVKPLGKHKAYLYKQPEADGLICVFYSSTPGLAKQNAYIFAEMYEEKFFDTLIVKTKPY